jgi:hypothetical protein
VALKFGRKPPYPRHVRPRVIFDAHADLAALTASVPKSVDRAFDVPSWPMYLNDQLSDCAEAGAGHAVQALTAWAGAPVTPADADVQALYEQTAGYVPGDPSTDGGTNLQDLLTWWSRNEWCGVQLEGFAELASWHAASLRACAYYFGTVYVGVSFPASGIAQFNAGEPWVPVPGDRIVGGHCIVLEQVTQGLDMLDWISWGRKQRSNRAWWSACAEEAWVPLTAQALAKPPPGVDTAGMMAEYRSLTGGQA